MKRWWEERKRGAGGGREGQVGGKEETSRGKEEGEGLILPNNQFIALFNMYVEMY